MRLRLEIQLDKCEHPRAVRVDAATLKCPACGGMFPLRGRRDLWSPGTTVEVLIAKVKP